MSQQVSLSTPQSNQAHCSVLRDTPLLEKNINIYLKLETLKKMIGETLVTAFPSE